MAEREPNTEARELIAEAERYVAFGASKRPVMSLVADLLDALEQAGRALEQEREKVRALRADYQIAYQSEGWSDVTGCPQCGNRSVAHWCPPVEEARRRLREALSSSPGAAAETDTSG